MFITGLNRLRDRAATIAAHAAAAPPQVDQHFSRRGGEFADDDEGRKVRSAATKV